MSDDIVRWKDKSGRLNVRRNTTIKQDLRDIGRMLVGGRGGRERSLAIDDKVTEAQTGKRRAGL